MRKIKIAENKLNKVAALIGERSVKLPILCRYLNKEFKSLSVKFRSAVADNFCVSGYFSPMYQLETDESKFNVLINYTKGAEVNSLHLLWEELILVMVHEFRHGYQYNQSRIPMMPARRQSFQHSDQSIVNLVNYFSDTNEIDAHAFEAAYAKNSGIAYDWIIDRHRIVLGEYDVKSYNRFLKKFYAFSNK